LNGFVEYIYISDDPLTTKERIEKSLKRVQELLSTHDFLNPLNNLFEIAKEFVDAYAKIQKMDKSVSATESCLELSGFMNKVDVILSVLSKSKDNLINLSAFWELDAQVLARQCRELLVNFACKLSKWNWQDKKIIEKIAPKKCLDEVDAFWVKHKFNASVRGKRLKLIFSIDEQTKMNLTIDVDNVYNYDQRYCLAFLFAIPKKVSLTRATSHKNAIEEFQNALASGETLTEKITELAALEDYNTQAQILNTRLEVKRQQIEERKAEKKSHLSKRMLLTMYMTEETLRNDLEKIGAVVDANVISRIEEFKLSINKYFKTTDYSSINLLELEKKQLLIIEAINKEIAGYNDGYKNIQEEMGDLENFKTSLIDLQARIAKLRSDIAGLQFQNLSENLGKRFDIIEDKLSEPQNSLTADVSSKIRLILNKLQELQTEAIKEQKASAIIKNEISDVHYDILQLSKYFNNDTVVKEILAADVPITPPANNGGKFNFCPQCGTARGGANFCSNCGYKF